ncbi:MAG TPA: hypothetical protein VGF84_05570 [Micromonosporaceae bacterium]
MTDTLTAPTPRAEIRGRAAGVSILAFFALAWTGWGTSDVLSGAPQTVVVVLAAIASIVLAAVAWRGYRRAAATAAPSTGGPNVRQSLDYDPGVDSTDGADDGPVRRQALDPRPGAADGGRTEPGGRSDAPDRAGSPDIGRRFGLIVAIEWIGLGVVAGLLGATGHAVAIPAVICFGVGLHFFPLARLFHVRIYVLTGILLCLIAVATLILAPLTSAGALWTALPGFGAAVVLYATIIALLRESAGFDESPGDQSRSRS